MEDYGFQNMDERDFNAIGKCSMSFAALEHMLTSAHIALLGGPEEIFNETPEQEEIYKAMGGTFGQKLIAFVKRYKEELPNDTDIDRFAEKIGQARDCRNHFLHGFWEKDGNLLRSTFFKRTKGKPQPQIWEGSAELLLEIHDQNTLNLKALQDFIITHTKSKQK